MAEYLLKESMLAGFRIYQAKPVAFMNKNPYKK